jgi:hypothetical protein
LASLAEGDRAGDLLRESLLVICALPFLLAGIA